MGGEGEEKGEGEGAGWNARGVLFKSLDFKVIINCRFEYCFILCAQLSMTTQFVQKMWNKRYSLMITNNHLSSN